MIRQVWNSNGGKAKSDYLTLPYIARKRYYRLSRRHSPTSRKLGAFTQKSDALQSFSTPISVALLHNELRSQRLGLWGDETTGSLSETVLAGIKQVHLPRNDVSMADRALRRCWPRQGKAVTATAQDRSFDVMGHGHIS